jgi:tetratricopeptide (TPR) repeat protein
MYEDIQERRGLELTRMERYREAVPLLKESLAFQLKIENRSDILSNLGLCYLELRDFESAKDHFGEAVVLGLTKEWEGQVHFGLGVAYFYTDMLREAKAEFQICEARVAEYQLPIASVYGWLASICKALGASSEAERYMRLAKFN